MISRNTARELLARFDISICDEKVDQLIAYVDLLLRWNKKINLTSISTAEECVTRHFGESFMISRRVELHGLLLDIGTGAGFPGLALKLIAPQLEVVLLEPVAKKRAFLKEVARACGMGPVHVAGSRLDEFARSEQGRTFDIITARAVGGLELLVPTAKGLLSPDGHLCLWVGTQQVEGIREADSGLQWLEPEAIPLSDERLIMVAVRAAPKFG
jgi:16S rRNA (guanine527-N7)-methyltransferase